FSPFFIATLPVSLPKQIVAMAFLKLFLSFFCTFLLARDLGLSEGAALFSAAAYAFSVFETVYLFYPLTAVSALLPLLLFALLRTCRNREWRWALLLSLCTAAALSGGHPETVVHLAIAGVIWLAIYGVDLAGVLRVGAGVGIGVAASAMAWLP